MTASFKFNCCSYLYELQSWQSDNHYTTLVPKIEAAAVLPKSLTLTLSARPSHGHVFQHFHVCNVNVENTGRPGYKRTAWQCFSCMLVTLKLVTKLTTCTVEPG